MIQAIHATGKAVRRGVDERSSALDQLGGHEFPAILETWFAGTQGGNAIADTLFGDVNPGGKLPVTFPRSVGQVPVYYNHKNTGRPPGGDSEDASRYIDIPWTPLYPFGYGLSYTQFRLSHLQLSATHIRPRWNNHHRS